MQEQKPCRHCRRKERIRQIRSVSSPVQLVKSLTTLVAVHLATYIRMYIYRQYSILADSYLKGETDISHCFNTLDSSKNRVFKPPGLLCNKIKARSIIYSFVSTHVSGKVVLRTPRGGLYAKVHQQEEKKGNRDDWKRETRQEK